MLTTSHLNSTMDENDLSTYLIIPFDSIKNPDECAQLRILPDGTLYIINQENQQVQDKPDFLSLQNKITDIESEQACTEQLPPVTTSIIQVPIEPLTEEIPPSRPEIISDFAPIIPSAVEVKYNCIKCDQRFLTIKEYKDHLQWHKSQKKFKCTSCGAGYNIENNLKIHNALIHPNGTLNSCPICGISLTFQRAASLRSHLMVHLVEEVHNCDECEAEIDKEDDYAQHLLTHASKIKDDQSSLTCSHCDVEFKTKLQLKLHVSDHAKAWRYFKKKKVKKITSKEKRYNCEVCNKSFIKQSLLERHERIHSGEKPFKCNICDQCFTQKGSLQIHLLRHTGNKPFACTLCPARFNQKGNLRVHINKTHTAPNEGQKMFKCPHCSCIFKRIASLNGHVTKAHVKYGLTEETLMIGSVMKNLRNLEESSLDPYVTLMESTPEGAEKKLVVQMKKIGDVRWYKCSYCSKMCKKPSDLIRHIRVHTREKPFACKVCRKSFSHKYILRSHMNTHSAVKNLKCKFCDSVFGSKKILNLHMRKHEKEKLSKWQCVTCGILFDDFEIALQHKMEQFHTIQSVLNKVMKQPLYQTVYGNLTFKPPRPKVPNTGTESSILRPFHCTVCDARFTKKINLKRHMKYHEGDRRYKCQICPKAFITSYRLKEHINLHNNIKNYACKTCNKRFGTSTNLRRHMITHNNQRPYMCPYCSKHFQTLDLSRRHIKSVHKKDVLPKIDTVMEALNENNDNNALCQGTSVIICNNKNEESNLVTNAEIGTIQHFVPEENSQPTQMINPSALQDPNTGLQTFYVNLEDLQLIDNSGISLSSLVENTGNEENFQITTNDPHEKDHNQQNQVLMYTSSTEPSTTLNLATPHASDVIFDGNSVVQTSVGLNETRNIFDDASIICMNCNKMFSSFIYFQKHNCSNSNKEHNSENIPKIMNEQSNFEKEIPIVEPEQPKKDSEELECPVCKKVFKKKILYRRHIKMHSNVKRSKCKQIISDKTEYLERAIHNSSIASSLYHCVFCAKEFKKPSDLKRHIRTHTGEKPFGCDICDKKFSLKSTLQSHIKTHDPNHKQFGCDICNTFYSSKSSLKVHMTIHTGQMRYSCSVCKAEFRTLSTKKSHEAVGHRRIFKKTLIKATKNRLTDILETLSSDKDEMRNNEVPEFVNLQTLNLVMDQNNLATQTQTLDLPSQIVNLDIPPETIISTITEVQSPDPSNLLQQLQMSDMVLTTNETEEVPSLILDDVSFLDLSAGTNNLQIISLPEVDGRVTISIKENVEKSQMEVPPKPDKEKPKSVECDICHKTYASKDGLRKHKKNVHGGNKNFGCEKCDEKFDTKEKLQNHKKDHCLCMLCAMKFSEEKSLKNHMKSCHHGNEASKEQTSALLNLKLDPLFNNLFVLKKL